MYGKKARLQNAAGRIFRLSAPLGPHDREGGVPENFVVVTALKKPFSGRFVHTVKPPILLLWLLRGSLLHSIETYVKYYHSNSSE